MADAPGNIIRIHTILLWKVSLSFALVAAGSKADLSPDRLRPCESRLKCLLSDGGQEAKALA